VVLSGPPMEAAPRPRQASSHKRQASSSYI